MIDGLIYATGHHRNGILLTPITADAIAQLLKTAQGQVAWLHASCSEWKNLFCFEIFGRDGRNGRSRVPARIVTVASCGAGQTMGQ